MNAYPARDKKILRQAYFRARDLGMLSRPVPTVTGI
jgi:hypothetical protein